jgi:ATP/maltotriose-dependent transcriptional regulator MalT
MLNATQWPRLEQWLNLFSSDVIEDSAELWMLKTWLVYHRGQLSELPTMIEHLDAILASELNQEDANRLVEVCASKTGFLALT